MKAFSKEVYHSDGFQVAERIYALKHPITKAIFYIGRTKKPLCDRLHGHISAAKGKSEKFRNAIKDKYIIDILDIGLKPIIETVEKVRPECFIEYLEIAEREIYWMKHFYDKGCSVMNIVGLKVPQPNAKYLWYIECKSKGIIPVEYYYAGKDAEGNLLYHKERMLIDGIEWPTGRPKANDYDPFKNPIWRAKMGLPVEDGI